MIIRILALSELGDDMPNKFPEGKLSRDDQGELEFKIAIVDGRVIMDWGKPIQWIGCTPSQARAIAAALIRNADRAEQETKGPKF